MSVVFEFRCNVPKGFDFADNYNPEAIPGDLFSILGVFENLGQTPQISDRIPLDRYGKASRENIGFWVNWYEVDKYDFNRLSLQDRFYFETVEEFLTECKKHNTYRKGLWGDGKPIIARPETR